MKAIKWTEELSHVRKKKEARFWEEYLWSACRHAEWLPPHLDIWTAHLYSLVTTLSTHHH